MNTAFLTTTVATILSVHVCKAAWDWCSEAAKCDANGKKEENTMCKYKEQKENEHYFNIVTHLTDREKELLLVYHNTYRDRMASGVMPTWPPAANMRHITWDDDLAKVALRWAYQVEHDHDACRRTQTFPNVGQNMDFIDRTDGPIEDGFKPWADEILNTDAPSLLNSYEFGKTWANFTNIIWATTYKIGCGAVTLVPRAAYLKRGKMVVCNYGPGSVNGSQVYMQGPACSSCPKGTACKNSTLHSHLCALPGEPEDKEDMLIGVLPNSFRETKRMIYHYFPSMMLLLTHLF